MSDQPIRTFSFPKGRSRGRLNIPERVHAFLVEHTPKPICDDCIAKGVDTNRETVNPLTNILGLTSDFSKRNDGICSLCKGIKQVTWSRRYA
jgi:hypothetical protein